MRGTLTATSGTLNLAGDFTNNGSYTHNNGLANFNGTALQYITGTSATTFNNLTLNNTSGLRMDVNANVNSTLTLSNGNLMVYPGVTLNIVSGTTVAGSGFGTAKHIVTEVNTLNGDKGFLRIGSFTGSKTYPVGSGTYYMPVLLNASGSNDFSVCVFPGATQNGQPNGTAFSALTKESIVDATWIVNRNGGSSAVTMSLNWPSALEGVTFQNFLDPEIGISHYDGSSWDSASGSGSQSVNMAARNSLISFSPFGVGKVGIPLGMKFKSIKVYQVNKGLEVDWTTLNEVDVNHYEIERSTDGTHFNKVGQVNAIGNAEAAEYTWVDPGASGQLYFYRIKAIDEDGKSRYSSIVRIDLHHHQKGISIYPNPVRDGQLSFHSDDLQKGNYQLVLYNASGQEVYKQPFSHAGGVVSEMIALPATLQSGYYILQLKDRDLSISANSFILKK